MISLFYLAWLLVSLIVFITGTFLLVNGAKSPPIIKNFFLFGKLLTLPPQKTRIFSSYTITFDYLLVPKSWFVHFYYFALILHFISLLIWLTCSSDNQCPYVHQFLKLIFNPFTKKAPEIANTVNIKLIYPLFGVHLMRRIYEEKFVFIPSSAKMNIFHYAIGFIFYSSAVLLNLNYLLSTSGILSSEISVYSRFALVIFMFGQVLQFHSHKILANLRAKLTKKDRNTHSKTYLLPVGGLFNLVSCPNYLAECLIWTSLLILTDFEMNMFALVLWVYANQIIAALHYHSWYKMTFFKSYPSVRKAIIPFIL